MNNANIQVLPPEILQKFIFKYLKHSDVYNLRDTGNMRMKEICEDYLRTLARLGKLWAAA